MPHGIRATLIIAAVVAVGPPAGATSCGGYLGVWPEPSTPLPTNGRLVLDAWGSPSAIILRIRDYRPTLASRWDVVTLRVEAIYSSQRGAQAILVPGETLRPGTRYELRFARYKRLTPREEFMVRMYPNFDLKADFEKRPVVLDHFSASWTTSDGPDKVAPGWWAPPEVVGAEYSEAFLRGGTVRLSTPVIDQTTDVGVLVHVRALEPSPWEDRPITQVIRVGRDCAISLVDSVCRGPFLLQTGVAYEAQFSAVDVAGHEVPAPGPPIRFRVPPPPPPPEFDVQVQFLGTSPRLLKGPAPVWTAIARKVGEPAVIDALLSVTAEGTVSNVEIVAKEGRGMNLHAGTCERDLLLWKFEPEPGTPERHASVRVEFIKTQPPYEADWAP